MNQDLHSDPQPGGGAQLDADAVCEQCGTVNEEGTLLCKICGQNLRDQRMQRLAGAGAQGPEVFEEGVNRVRLLTGLLTVFGILIIVLAVLNITNIEAGLVDVLSDDVGADSGGLWSGASVHIYEELQQNLDDYPTSRARIDEALENPVDEESFDGRYILLRPGLLSSNRVIGEANLSRRGEKVYFVATLRQFPAEIRGFAKLQTGDDEVLRLVARDTAGMIVEGKEYSGYGFAEKLEGGGHSVVIASDYGELSTNQEILAFRVR